MHKELQRRLKRVEGQVRGVQRLLDEGADCEAVVLQLSAIKGALQRVGMKVATCQLGTRMAEEIKQGGTGKEASDELTETFLRLA